jgi:hypothetical protein
LFGSTAGANGPSVTSCHWRSPPTVAPGAPTDVATNDAIDATRPSSSTKPPSPPCAVDRGSADSVARSATFATALLPAEP